MWVLKPIWAYVNAKYGSCMPGNRSKIFNVKVIHNPCNCEPLSKLGRLLTWTLFQELESAVHWSDGYIMLIGLSLCTCWCFIFWWSLIRIVCYTAVFSVVTQRSLVGRSVDAPGSKQLSANTRVIRLCTCVMYWSGRGLMYVCQLLLSLL